MSCSELSDLNIDENVDNAPGSSRRYVSRSRGKYMYCTGGGCIFVTINWFTMTRPIPMKKSDNNNARMIV